MKGSLRKIVVNKQTWHWVVEAKPKVRYSIKEVRIYSPDKTMIRVNPDDIYTIDYEGYEDYNNYGITPEMVRIYIKKLIKTQKETTK